MRKLCWSALACLVGCGSGTGTPSDLVDASAVSDASRVDARIGGPDASIFGRGPEGPQAYLKGSEPLQFENLAFNNFGIAVAIRGNTVAVGEHFFDDGKGRVHIFTGDEGVWTEEQILVAEGGRENDLFGSALAISGDTLAVGARGRNTDTGAVYVYVRSSSIWEQEAVLAASNAEQNDRFGFSLAIEGDVLLVGSNGEDSSGLPGNNDADSAGAVYAFERNTATWIETDYIKAAIAQENDVFGESVAISGDLIAIGARGEASASGADPEDNSLGFAGAAYVFRRVSGRFEQEAYLKAANPDALDGFGTSIAVSADTLLVGAPNEDGSGVGIDPATNNTSENSGAAYVFRLLDGIWSQESYLKASNTEPANAFGKSVSLSGNLALITADGETSLSQGLDASEAQSTTNLLVGAAYSFERSSVWSQTHYIKATNAEDQDAFGVAASMDGDLIVIGAKHEDSDAVSVNGDQANNSATRSGAAYVYRLPAD